jgi:SAM-dependent methyltransferase
MLRQAARRNAAAIAAGQVTLTKAPAGQLPDSPGGPFDAILAFNSLGFWPTSAERLGELRRRLRPGGRIAIASQPRWPGATAATSRSAAREIEALLDQAGYAKTRTEALDLDPPVVCVLAVNPDPGSSENGAAPMSLPDGAVSAGERMTISGLPERVRVARASWPGYQQRAAK